MTGTCEIGYYLDSRALARSESLTVMGAERPPSRGSSDEREHARKTTAEIIHHFNLSPELIFPASSASSGTATPSSSKRCGTPRQAARKTQIEKNDKGQRVLARCPWLIPVPGISPESNQSYWLSGLKARMPASVLEQTPAGSTRTTASSSAQKPRIPVWLIESGTALIV